MEETFKRNSLKRKKNFRTFNIAVKTRKDIEVDTKNLDVFGRTVNLKNLKVDNINGDERLLVNIQSDQPEVLSAK